MDQVKDVRVPEQLMRAMAAEAEAAREARAKVMMVMVVMVVMMVMIVIVMTMVMMVVVMILVIKAINVRTMPILLIAEVEANEMSQRLFIIIQKADLSWGGGKPRRRHYDELKVIKSYLLVDCNTTFTRAKIIAQ